MKRITAEERRLIRKIPEQGTAFGKSHSFKLFERCSTVERRKFDRHSSHSFCETTVARHIVRVLIVSVETILVRLEGETSNALLETLQDWNTDLKQSGYKASGPRP